MRKMMYSPFFRFHYPLVTVRQPLSPYAFFRSNSCMNSTSAFTPSIGIAL
jgi:hypothetical protein